MNTRLSRRMGPSLAHSGSSTVFRVVWKFVVLDQVTLVLVDRLRLDACITTSPILESRDDA